MNGSFRRIDTHRFGPWALVTGASSGIGREFARQLAANGLNLVLAARRRPVLDDVGRDLAARHGVEYRCLPVDLAADGALDAVVDATDDLDIGLIISSTGDMVLGEFLTTDRDDLLRELTLNAETHLGLSHHFGQRLSRRRRGGIMLVSSIAGLQPVPYVANYAATKAYLLTLGAAIHRELAPSGINVTVLTPGATDTPMITRFGADHSPMRRMIMPVQACVSDGLAALSANRPVRISGRMNRATIAVLPRSARSRVFGAMNRSMAERVTPATPPPVHAAE
ncbi:SDR family NAD(P)-dependent oxidoreductase [Dactylosporangium matsuzakiense]|uniref:Short-chain dehydrogenase n=1 Tax=Dactylosporangium matsuzakiense TaxID=53360 RepID=A0A9W6NJG8_9ACTN|nr:SDR family NAD(P)-dependent oxidoreductase [Dactylosporangium matsuzakiense]UWZ42262.1 SDR family NAD(P)-dependent oxidoreductase [Dactylosporangium matsuzakiense]GLK99919.1 short-chain dehydrogenase [Dactylosporangium matsuzakiense]